MPFVRVDITSDATLLADDAITRLMTQWEGWEPNDGDMEVIQIETIAPMAQNTAEVAAIVPDAIFRTYAQKLLNLPYNTGTPAHGTATFYAIDNAGYDSSPYTVEISIDGVAFITDQPVVIPASQSSVAVPITCQVDGIIGNDMTGSAELLDAVPWIDTILIDAPTSAGSDAEDDQAYQDRISDRLQLQSTTLVTGRDFELMALQDPRVGRALAIVNQARKVDVALTDPAGEPVAQAVKDDILALYADYRQVNTQYSILNPTYTTINVTFQLVSLPTNDAASVHDEAISAVRTWLDPFNWGRPPNLSDPNMWLNETVVRYSELVRVLSVYGVRYVQAATLNGGTADINLTGTAPLTRPGTITGTVT